MSITVAKASSLKDAARLHWQDFCWMWVWPAFFYFSWILLAAFGALRTDRGAMLSFFLLEVPVFFVASHKAARPVRTGAVSRMQHLVWAQLVPFAIWAVLCFLPFGLLYVLEKAQHAA